MDEATFAIAVFPFLMTSNPVRIGGHVFRSTSDIDGLGPAESKALREIALMLYAQNDLRVQSASYTILPDLEIHSGDDRIRHLEIVRDVVTYFYASPHETFEDVFLRPEETGLVVFTPGRVSSHFTRRMHRTIGPALTSVPESENFGYVPGYRGMYNFRYPFWVEAGARLYGSKPHMALKISQDLCVDIEHRSLELPYYGLLFELLERPETPASARICSALRWFNASCEEGLDHSRALLNLAVAFETLLRLPESSKTDRLVDAISLLLGRTERLDNWAQQFYAARSRVAHEGEVRDQYFYVRSPDKRAISDVFGSLMLYGRQIFRLCVGTLLVGIHHAERTDLEEKLVSNNERYQRICDALRKKAGTPNDGLLGLAPTINALERYRFVSSASDSTVLLAAVRHAASTVVSCQQRLPDELSRAIAQCATEKPRANELSQLTAVKTLDEVFKKLESPTVSPEVSILHSIVDLVWMSLFQKYHWLDEKRKQNRSPDDRDSLEE